ncbi:MAG: hypothetical protein K1X91_08770 [Bacteriodetes bacterium]|nr:hypothetical protein [Bacteroidota bacterium]
MSYVVLPFEKPSNENPNGINCQKWNKIPKNVKKNLPKDFMYYIGNADTAIYYPSEATLFGKSMQIISDSRKPSDNSDKGFTWEISWKEFQEQHPTCISTDNQIYFDMDPWSNNRVWIAQPEHIYGYTDKKTVYDKEWAILLIVMKEIYRFPKEDDNGKVKTESDVWRARYSFFEKPEPNTNKRFFEFVYLKANDNETWKPGKPGASNSAAIYVDAMLYFNEKISSYL